MEDGIPIISQTRSDFIAQSSPFFKRTNKSHRFFKGDSDLRSCSPIKKDSIETYIPRFHNVSPHTSLTYERHYRIKNLESPKLCETKNHTECVKTPFFRKKRERSPVSTPGKVEGTEPISGGRWVLSALRHLPLVGSLVSSQDDQNIEKQSQTATPSTQELNDDFNLMLPSTSLVNVTCDVVSSPSFKCLAEKSGNLQKKIFSTVSNQDNFTVPLPYETHSNIFYYNICPPTSQTRLQPTWDKSPLYTKTSEPTDDLKSVLTLRRQYGLGDILLDSCDKSNKDIVQYKRPRLSSPVVSCSSDLKPSGFHLLPTKSWNPSSPKLSVSKSQGTLFHYKNEDNITTKGIGETSNESTERLSIRSFKKKRGLRAVDYRRLLQQAKFQPCHWIDYFDYMKAKNADDQDKEHYVLNKKFFSYETENLQESKNLSVVQNSKWKTDDKTDLFKSSLTSSLQKDVKEPLTASQEKTLPLNVVHSVKDIPSKSTEKDNAQSLHDSIQTSCQKNEIPLPASTFQECSRVPQDTFITSNVKESTGLDHSKEKKEQVTSKKTVSGTGLPWWKNNLNKTIQVDVEGDGVFAENADDDVVQPVSLGQTLSEQTVHADSPSLEPSVALGQVSSEQDSARPTLSSEQKTPNTTSNKNLSLSFKPSILLSLGETSTWTPSSPFLFKKDSSEKEPVTSLFSKPTLNVFNLKETPTSSPFSLQVPAQEKTDVSLNFQAPCNKTFKKPCVSQTTSTESLNNTNVCNNIFPSSETTQETKTQQGDAFSTKNDTPQTSSFLNSLQTSSLPFVSTNTGLTTRTQTTEQDKPSLFFNNLSTSSNTTTLLNDASPSQNIPSSFLKVNTPQGNCSMHNTTAPESIQSNSQPTTSNPGSLFKPQETTSLFSAPLALNTAVSPFGVASSIETPKTSLFSLPSSSSSFFGNPTTATSTTTTDKPFSTSPLHGSQQKTSNDSIAPGIQKNFTFTSGLFSSQPSTCGFNLSTTPSTLKPDSTDSILNVTTPSLFNSLPTSTPDNTSLAVPKPFETPQVPLFSFGATTPTTDPSNVMAMNLSTSPNPFAANAGTFASSTPRRPKLRLKRTLR